MTGNLAWGDLGRTFRGFSPDTMFFVADIDLTSTGDLMVMDYLEVMHAVGPDTIITDLACAYRVDPGGELVWSPGKLDLSTSEGVKSVPLMSEPVNEMYVISWVENREMPMLGFGSVYAQNFYLGGSLGPLIISEAKDPKRSISVYPNPAKDILIIRLDGLESDQPVQLNIYDSQGRRLLTRKGEASPILIDVSRFAFGIYLVKFEGVGLSLGMKFLVAP